MYSVRRLIIMRQLSGYSDLNNLGRALEKHNKSKEHIASACKFVLFGKQNIATIIDPTATAIPR
jgi:hypothetical protein